MPHAPSPRLPLRGAALGLLLAAAPGMIPAALAQQPRKFHAQFLHRTQNAKG